VSGASASLTSKAISRFTRHRLAVGGSIIMLAVVLIAVVAPLVTMDPDAIDLRAVRQPPSGAHLFGTDLIGRDVWSRVAHGARTSLAVGILAVSMYVLVGTLLGALAGYFGGWLDHLVMRLVDIVLSIPILLMVIVFVSVVGPGLISVITVIGLLGWPGTARLVRGQLLSLREEDFIMAARVVGASATRIVLRHLLPNTLAPLTVLATFGVATAILLEASLSFLGLGVRPPTPSWGNILFDAQSPTVLSEMPWLWLAPGLAIAITVLAVNFIGDGIRDAVDPRANL
jgi:peptide/nickel transport system permease protein